MTPLKVTTKLFEARDTVHLIHLNTKSFAEHKALDTFYNGWLDLTDNFIETYQGKYGRVSGTVSIDCNIATDSNAYLTELMVFLNTDINTILDLKIDSDLLNIVADMKSLVNHTKYLLTLK